MAHFRLIREALGYPVGTTIASDYFAVIPGDVLCPALCQRPDPNILVALDHQAVTCFAAVGVITTENQEPPKETST